MMRFSPTLIVTRLVVERLGAPVYDERFHDGVNIIRGDNSSGKSTVLNLIFYGLGGDLTAWSAVARLCTRVVVEVRLNGNFATLSREISANSTQQPMEIFGGAYDASLSAARSEWLKFPYRRADHRESFSQALFRLLEIPEVASDLSGNITINQILRLLYADQLSPVEDIFRFQRFDDATLRDTVGRLLCGAYDSALYDNEQTIRALSRKFDAVNAELQSLFAVLGTSDHPLTLEWFDAEKKSLAARRSDLALQIETAERAAFAGSETEALSLAGQEAAYDRVVKIQARIAEVTRERDAAELGVADSNAFIQSMRNKIEALQDSSRVAEQIGDVQFYSCPACYAPIEDGADTHACHLCKAPFDSERTRARIVGLINDLAVQIKQSEELQRLREKKLGSLDDQLVALRTKWAEASQRLTAMQQLPSSAVRNRLRELQVRSGYLDRESEDLARQAKLAALVANLSDRKSELNGQIVSLKESNEALRVQQQNRLSQAYTAIANEIKKLLRNDLRRQDTFEDPDSISFTFSDNKVSVNGESYFSASSRAILKSSFCLAFLSAATKHAYFRHPRFCMIDTLENMGVEQVRSQNFQMQVVRVSEENSVEHQIIFATAMIDPQLDKDVYTVGRYYTRDHPTLAIEASAISGGG